MAAGLCCAFQTIFLHCWQCLEHLLVSEAVVGESGVVVFVAVVIVVVVVVIIVGLGFFLRFFATP